MKEEAETANGETTTSTAHQRNSGLHQSATVQLQASREFVNFVQVENHSIGFLLKSLTGAEDD